MLSYVRPARTQFALSGISQQTNTCIIKVRPGIIFRCFDRVPLYFTFFNSCLQDLFLIEYMMIFVASKMMFIRFHYFVDSFEIMDFISSL